MKSALKFAASPHAIGDSVINSSRDGPTLAVVVDGATDSETVTVAYEGPCSDGVSPVELHERCKAEGLSTDEHALANTVGCNITEAIGTPRCRLSPRTYSQQYKNQEECAICDEPFDEHTPEFASMYANPVCEDCDDRAVTGGGERPDYGNEFLDRDTPHETADGELLGRMVPNVGNNSAFIDGQKR